MGKTATETFRKMNECKGSPYLIALRAEKIDDCRWRDKEGMKKKRVVKDTMGEGWGRMKRRTGGGGEWPEIACYGLFLNLCQNLLLRLSSCVTHNGTSLFHITYQL